MTINMECPSKFGLYDYMITLVIPDHMRSKNDGYYTTKETVDIDKCIVDEIKYLWDNKVHTMACCCGHGKVHPSVAVLKKSNKIMQELGYKKDETYTDIDVYFLKTKHN